MSRTVSETTPTTAQALAGADRYKWVAFWVIAIAFFTMVMDFSVTGIALPSIAREFDLTLRVVSWVAIGGSLTITAFLLPLGRLADIAGRKAVHLTGIAFFCSAALVAAFAPNLAVLIAARVVMAFGAAMIQAVGMAMVTSVFPPEERGKSVGMITTVVGIGAIAGPALGGPIVDAFGWRSVYFFLFVPAAAGFFLALKVLDNARVGSVKKPKGEAYDWLGAGTSAAFLALIIFTISNPLDLSWTSAPVVAGGVASAALLASFVWWELRVKVPMISLRFFRDAQFTWSTVSRFLAFLGGTASWFLMPFYIQDVLGYSPGTVGLVLFFGALGMTVAAFFSGRLSDRFGTKRFMLAGLAINVVTNGVFIMFGANSSVWLIIPALFLNGVGMGTWIAPNTSMTLASVERSSYGIVGAFVNLVRNVANVAGLAIATAVVAGVMVSRGVGADLSALAGSGDPATASAFVAGMRLAFMLQAVLVGLALLAATFTRESRQSARAPTLAATALKGASAAGDGK